MHDMAEYGIAAPLDLQDHRRRPHARRPRPGRRRQAQVGCGGSSNWQQELEDSSDFVETLKVDLFEDEVFVFHAQGRGQVLNAGATPLDFAYEIHTDVGHRCVGAKVNNKIVPLHYELQSGDIVEVLTSQARARALARLACAGQDHARAQQDQAVVPAESRKDNRARGRELAGRKHMRKQGLPAQRLVGAPDPRPRDPRDGFKKADDFYIALGPRRFRRRSSRRR